MARETYAELEKLIAVKLFLGQQDTEKLFEKGLFTINDCDIIETIINASSGVGDDNDILDEIRMVLDSQAMISTRAGWLDHWKATEELQDSDKVEIILADNQDQVCPVCNNPVGPFYVFTGKQAKTYIRCPACLIKRLLGDRYRFYLPADRLGLSSLFGK